MTKTMTKEMKIRTAEIEAAEATEEEQVIERISLNEDFEKLVKHANDIQADCTDRLVKANEIRMDNELLLAGSPLSPLAEGHLCGKLQVPSRYFTRLVKAGQKELAAENINVWLQDDDKRKFLLREYKGTIRGVLSGSYSKYDAPEILNTIAEVFDPSEFKLKGSFINEERLHLRLCENKMMNVNGEDLFAGIALDSSDVGRAGLSVKFLVWKQVCTNGLVIAKESAQIFRQKHVGISHDDFIAGLKEGFERFYDLKDNISRSIEATAKVELNRGSAEDDDELIEHIQNITGLSEESSNEVLNVVDLNYKRTRWGLINGITEVAQQFTLERRIELETIAGNLLVPVKMSA